MRYVVREGTRRGCGRYLNPDVINGWSVHRTRARVQSKASARASAKHWGGRVVRLLSPAEAKRKAIATEIRRIVEEDCAEGLVVAKFKPEAGVPDCTMIMTDFLLKRADALWPAKGPR